MGMSQEEFGKFVGLNRGNIASYEKQTAEPSIMNLSRIGKHLKVELSDLIDKDLAGINELISQIEDADAEGQNTTGVAEELLMESLEEHQFKLERFRKRTDEMASILEGFKQFHKFRMEKFGGLSDDVKKMALDYEKLLEVLEDVLSTNKHMLKLLDSNEE